MSTTNETHPNATPAVTTRHLYLFTRTPLHVGAGTSVGAVDQPVQRERHTGFPVVPASSLKGTFADAWNSNLLSEPAANGGTELKRVLKDGTVSEPAWLFGSDEAGQPFAGAVQFSEARLLAFPIRSARGSFAWITCPLILRRASRDGVLKNGPGQCLGLPEDSLAPLTGGAGDKNALFAASGPLALTPAKDHPGDTLVVLEEYTFTHCNELPPGLGPALQNLLPADEVWKDVASRLVVLSDGMMSFFCRNACEVAQHVRINDQTGTADHGGLFDQENVPSEALFYSVLRFFSGRGTAFKGRTAEQACMAFQGQDASGKDQPGAPGVRDGSVFQIGGDASTGLGYCTVVLK